MLNHRVSGRVELGDVDFDCLDIIARHGPIGPTALARRAGVHPATMTGVLARLEDGGWIVRERTPGDRRAVVVRGVADRQREIVQLFAGIDAGMDPVCAAYADAELATITGFPRAVTAAGLAASDDLA